MNKGLVFVICMSLSVMGNAQSCKPNNIVATNEIEQYLINSNGTVSDVETGLMWMTCSIGQVYADQRCLGVATDFDSWQQALQYVESFNLSGGYSEFTDFRLPNIKELGSIVERQCNSPAINFAIFPDTPSSTYYSSTPSTSDWSLGSGARSIYFGNGEDFTPEVSAFRNIRLVRDVN